MKQTTLALAVAAVAAAGFSGSALSQAKEQFIPANFYWVGPYAPGAEAALGARRARSLPRLQLELRGTAR